MTEDLITLETAKLAKEKGFPQNFQFAQFINITGSDWKFFDKDEADRLDDNIGIGLNIRISTPTQSLLQKWLREKYNIVVNSSFMSLTKESGWCYYIYPDYKKSWLEFVDSKIDLDIDLFQTYEDALEIGLQEALKLI